MSSLGPIITAMITPFDEQGNVDLDEAARLARWLVDRNHDGLVVAGSTGEGQTMSAQERVALFRAVKEAVGENASVIANAGSNDTRDSVASVAQAEKAGADAILAVVPYYNKPTQSGMLAHFGQIADATRLPIVIYNIPGRTGTNLLPETLLELARRHSNIIGVKESSGDLMQIGAILADRPPEFLVLAGDDHLFLPCLAMGADGVVGVASHLCSPQYAEMIQAYRDGDGARAAHIHLSLLPLIRALFATTNPIAVKWAMRQLGFKTGECRLPLDTIPEAVAPAVAAASRRVPRARAISVVLSVSKTLEILGCRLDPIDADAATSAIVDFALQGRGAQIVTLGTEMVVYAQRDARYRAVINSCALSLCDTAGLLAVARRRGAQLQQRVTGADLIEHLCARAARESIRIFLFGGAPGVAEEAAQVLLTRYPGLQIAGTRNGFFSASESPAIAQQIRASGAQLLLAGMGFPKQEFWLADYLRETGCGAAIGVGGSFDVISGKVERAPASWRRLNLEWLYRLVKEPKRWRRQLALPHFVLLLAGERVRSRLARGKT